MAKVALTSSKAEPPADNEVYLSTGDVLARWRGTIKRKTLSNWRCVKGRGPRFKKVGSKILYRMDWIKEFEGLKGYTSTEDYGRMP
jgi:hypothetical protein